MKTYNVSIERNGVQIEVGKIIGNDLTDACFQYAESYLHNSESVPVSLSLPLQKSPFSPSQTRNYFEGLLPEGFTRKSVAEWMHVDQGDYLSILAGLGKECLGAVKIFEEQDTETAPSYEKLSVEQVRELAREGAVKSAELVTRSHLSLTGASGKVGLYYNEKDHNWYLPKGDAPSTHIVKQSHIRLDSIVTNEQLSLMTAKKLGISVPESFIINLGDARDEDILFATQRYDRMNDKKISTREINHMKAPVRLHQEDFAQALGISSAHKYEKKEEGYLPSMFQLLRQYSSDPVQDQLKLWDIVVFHYLIGNTDGHIKNFSLLHGVNMKQIRLAPAYDIVSTVVYKESTRDMAFYIGGEVSLDKITESNFKKAAKDVGLGQKMAMDRFYNLCNRFRNSLSEAAGELEALGFEKTEQIYQQILKSGGIQVFS